MWWELGRTEPFRSPLPPSKPPVFPCGVSERFVVQTGRDPTGTRLKRTPGRTSLQRHFLPWAVATQSVANDHTMSGSAVWLLSSSLSSLLLCARCELVNSAAFDPDRGGTTRRNRCRCWGYIVHQLLITDDTFSNLIAS